MRWVVFSAVLLGLATAMVPPSCNVAGVLNDAVVKNSSYCPVVWATGLSSPRGIDIASNGDVLVVEKSREQITVLWADGSSPSSASGNRAVLARQEGLNHAVVIHGDYVYASSATDVYRWKYKAGMRQDLGPATHVVKNVPCCHHVTRALRFDADGILYVQDGSNSNVDPDSTHARIKRFNISKSSDYPLDWDKQDKIFADGLRNEAGIRFDPYNRLWGVENGVDQLHRDDLGGDIHDNNPGEELNFFPEENAGKFYGYPYCWSEYNLSLGLGPKTQWAQPDFMDTVTDQWCQDLNNVVPPKHVSQAHMAPLDIIFSETDKEPMIAYVAFHGSWNRNPPVGYRVEMFQISSDTQSIDSEPLLAYQGPGEYKRGWIRPVGLAFGDCGIGTNCLFVTSDATDEIVAISHNW